MSTIILRWLLLFLRSCAFILLLLDADIQIFRMTGKWSFPGGHLDQGEDFATCAKRETLEETGLLIRALEVVAMTNDVFHEADKHYISIFMACERLDSQQQPEVRRIPIHAGLANHPAAT